MSREIDLAGALEEHLRQCSPDTGDSPAINPGKRVKLVWPPEAVSLRYHVSARDFTETISIESHGEPFDVQVADTPWGVFGRCSLLWNEARGDTREEMLAALVKGMEPMVQRMLAISDALGVPALVRQPIKHMGPIDLLRLLYCRDRDAAMEAQRVIESEASSHNYLPALLVILRDRIHPLRRSPQWCVLDMFEDLPAFAHSQEEMDRAVEAIEALMWDAPDDYCRTIYKAGVVLGGHICTEASAEAMVRLLSAPSRVARRSAAHAVFHLNEWMPQYKERIVDSLRSVAAKEPEEILKAFQLQMADDIAKGSSDHVTEPVFADEPV